MSKCPEQYRGVGYSCPRIPSDSLCIKSRNNFLPFSIRLIAERVTPTREPNFSADSPKIVRNSLIRSFNKHPGDYQVPVLADDCEKFQGDLCLYQLWRNWMS